MTWCISARSSIQNELDDILSSRADSSVNDKIVLEGVRQVRDGEKVEYEFRHAGRGPGTTRKTTRNSNRCSPHRLDRRTESVGTEHRYLRTMFAKILHRPALAIVISMIILFLGVLAIKTLPISQFPYVAPPSVDGLGFLSRRQCQRPGRLGPDSLEQAINGVQNMRYMASAATSAGEATILIIFEPGTDPNVDGRERAITGSTS